MFFIFGVDPREKQLEFDQAMICPCCGRFGRYALFMTYMCFSLFFIPVVKWNRRYFIRASCCRAEAEISRELAEQLVRKERGELKPEELRFSGSCGVKRCARCGFATTEDYAFRPKCGGPL